MLRIDQTNERMFLGCSSTVTIAAATSSALSMLARPGMSGVRPALPATIGAIGGTLLALRIDEGSFKRILAFLMVAVTLWTIWDPLQGRRLDRHQWERRYPNPWPGS